METQRLWQALQLKRDAFVWMQFNQAANGDAVLIVAAVYAVWVAFIFLLDITGLPVLQAGVFSVAAFVNLFIRGGFGWILGSGAVWLIVSYVFEQPARFGTVIPITGYAHAPLVLVPVAAAVGLAGGLAMLFAGIWSAAMMVTGFQSNLDVSQERAVGLAIAPILVWLLFVGLAPPG